MAAYERFLLSWSGWLPAFALGFAGFAAILRGVVFRPRRARWKIARKAWRSLDLPPWLVKLCRADRDSQALHERKVLLAGCGSRIDPVLYLAWRRIVMCLLLVVSALGCWLHEVECLIAATSAVLAAWFDGMALHALRRYRTDRIRRELIAAGSQLLYYTGSRLHLHGKLMRCLPLTRIIRHEMGLMLNEWYHDPDRALRIFQERLGTDEAFGFSECLRSLRLHESEEGYDLLREMLREYKAKIELARDGRKETASYALFVLAGIPVLYTFQVFLYPWVQEAAQLFDALNP